MASVLALASIITIHEAGHFLAARLLGVHIQEFSVGVGPALLQGKVRTCVCHAAGLQAVSAPDRRSWT